MFHLPVAGEPFTIEVTGTATDTMGSNPGVDHVWIVVRNLEREYYCGSARCGTSGESSAWQPTYRRLFVPVASPGATSTGWTFSFETYDHPHDYRVTAWAVDEDGNQNLTKASIRVCVNAGGGRDLPLGGAAEELRQRG